MQRQEDLSTIKLSERNEILFKLAIWVLRRAYKIVDYPWDRWILAAVDTLEYYYGKRPELEEIRSKIKGVRK